jgi:hypothetical protein
MRMEFGRPWIFSSRSLRLIRRLIAYFLRSLAASLAWQQTNRSQILFTGIIEAGLNSQSGDKAAEAVILTQTLIRAGELKSEAIGSGDVEKYYAAVSELTTSTDPAVRMAAMVLEKLLNEPSDPEEGQNAEDDPS